MATSAEPRRTSSHFCDDATCRGSENHSGIGDNRGLANDRWLRASGLFVTQLILLLLGNTVRHRAGGVGQALGLLLMERLRIVR
jgi:hypothetical protein